MAAPSWRVDVTPTGWGGRDYRWREIVLNRCAIRDCKKVSVFAEHWI